MDVPEQPTGKRWTECNHCGHWFDRSLPTCDACQKPNDGSLPAPVDDRPVTTWLVIRVSLAIFLTLMYIGLFAFSGHRVVTGWGLLLLLGVLFGLVRMKDPDEKK